MKLLLDTIADLAPMQATAFERKVYAMRAWSMVHGLATLMLDGVVPKDEALIDGVIDGDTL